MSVTLPDDVVAALLAAVPADADPELAAAVAMVEAAVAMSGIEDSELLDWIGLRNVIRPVHDHDERVRHYGPTQADHVEGVLDSTIARYGHSFDRGATAAGAVAGLGVVVKFSAKKLELGRSSDTLHTYLTSTIAPAITAVARHAPPKLFR